jgi:uncharacterized membrane protein YfcA
VPLVHRERVREPAAPYLRQFAAVGPQRTCVANDGPDAAEERGGDDDITFDLHVEAYNLLNQTNFNISGFALGAADFGVISSAAGANGPTRREADVLMAADALALVVITLAAAVVNGALGYGFSSITVPLALLLFSNRALNPSLVLIEVALNAYVLWVNRDAVHHVLRRVWPIVIGLAAGVAVGTLVVARIDPTPLKAITYVALLPLILIQAAGYRRPIRAERSVGAAFGTGVGVLYSMTTISGPPLAVVLNNQGLAKREFRAALGLIRLAESSFTAIAYATHGLFAGPSVTLLPWILPSVAVGVPIGAIVIQHVRTETFRRICMSFDAWVVAFGLSMVVRHLQWINGHAAYSILLTVILVDACLLYRFFRPLVSRSATPVINRSVAEPSVAQPFGAAR